MSFAPIVEPDGTGNGTHIHFSFLDGNDEPVLYDADRRWGLSVLGGQFIAGILQYLPALCALTTPSVASYYRLRPNRWAPVRADVGLLDRGAAVRICPVSGNERAERARRELAEHRPGPLPTSLGEALTLLEECKRAGEWLGGELLPAYVRFKRAEIQGLDRLEESEIIRRYAEVY